MSVARRTVAGRRVGAIGLGCSGLSLFPPPREQALATIHAALDAGMQLLDTAPAYVPDAASQGHNESLVAEALRTWDGDRSATMVVCKGGHARVGDGHNIAVDFEVCGRPDYLRRQAEESLRLLGVESLDLYLLHQPDPRVPISESMGALEELRREGKVERVGVCNVTVDQLEECQGAGHVDAVQNAFSPLVRDRTVLDWCEEHDVPYLGHSVLGGLFGPRVDELPAIAEVAQRRRVSPYQVALAWELEQSDVLLPIAGCRRPSTATDSAAAMTLVLDSEDLHRLADIAAEAQPFDVESTDERRSRLLTRLDALIAQGTDR